MIDEKKRIAFKEACAALAEDNHNVLSVVLEREFEGKDFQFIRAIHGSELGLYCAFQLLVDNLFQVGLVFDKPEYVEDFMKKAFEIGIKKAKGRLPGTASDLN